MKLLLNFLPIALFFATYKFYNIYYATALMIATSLIQTLFYLYRNRKLETQSTITLVVAVLLGSATIISRNELFIKWKPTVAFWIFALLLVLSQYIWKKNIIKTIMEEKISLPQHIWTKVNLSWILFLVFMGAINLYIAYTFSTDIWVNFKLFGTLGGVIAFSIAQSIYISKHSNQ